jgi:hypothetical protein
MIIMPSNNTGARMRELLQRFPGQLAHLMGPERGGWRTPLADFALDNGAYGLRKTGGYPHGRLLGLYGKMEGRVLHDWCMRPVWVAVPDVVYDARATLAQWRWAAPYWDALYMVRLALVVQDGMTPDDVWQLDRQPDVVFVGGSTDWKWASLSTWTQYFRHVHVGRVNWYEGLWQAAEAGAESCDGTGWFRGPPHGKQYQGLIRFLTEWQQGRRTKTKEG